MTGRQALYVMHSPGMRSKYIFKAREHLYEGWTMTITVHLQKLLMYIWLKNLTT